MTAWRAEVSDGPAVVVDLTGAAGSAVTPPGSPVGSAAGGGPGAGQVAGPVRLPTEVTEEEVTR